MILQADSDPSRDGVGPLSLPSLETSRGCVAVWGSFGKAVRSGSVYIVPQSAPFSSVVTLQACCAQWGEQGKGSGGS